MYITAHPLHPVTMLPGAGSLPQKVEQRKVSRACWAMSEQKSGQCCCGVGFWRSLPSMTTDTFATAIGNLRLCCMAIRYLHKRKHASVTQGEDTKSRIPWHSHLSGQTLVLVPASICLCRILSFCRNGNHDAHTGHSPSLIYGDKHALPFLDLAIREAGRRLTSPS